jgi:hypothetical protein
VQSKTREGIGGHSHTHSGLETKARRLLSGRDRRFFLTFPSYRTRREWHGECQEFGRNAAPLPIAASRDPIFRDRSRHIVPSCYAAE